MIAVARHGETTWNVAGRYQGRMESELTELGAQQATALANAYAAREKRGIAVPQRIVSSPLLRCTATAQFVADRLGMTVETDPRLLEIGHGTWEGRLKNEIAADDPERYERWRERPAEVAFDGGERLADVAMRWHAFVATLEPIETLVVTHDAVVRVALLAAMQRPLDDLWQVRVENGAYAEFAFDPESASLRVVNECVNAHLAGIHAAITEQAL